NDFIRKFVHGGDEIVIRTLEAETDLAELLQDAESFDLIVASGGDGTVSSVSYQIAGKGIPILPFPAGTANLLALNLNLPVEPHSLAQLTRAEQTMDFDLGEIEVADGKKIGFSIMAGAGYDAIIMREAEHSKKLLGSMAYFSAAFTNTKPPVAHFKLDIDGKNIETDGVGVVIVNFSKIQFDITVAYPNMPRDGLLDITVLKTKDAFGLLPAFFAKIFDPTGLSASITDAMDFYRGRVVRVESDPPLQIQFDGEASQYTTPFTARVIPHAVRYVVSEEASVEFSDEAMENEIKYSSSHIRNLD
ncbi:MAG: NAD(+)/NADH kinase, partial [Eggerthellaceae bacterium]|nr:NAD(+)/NADH kinase [Eggerthellaceae bacterium]